jgi:hypothetical protein
MEVISQSDEVRGRGKFNTDMKFQNFSQRIKNAEKQPTSSSNGS